MDAPGTHTIRSHADEAGRCEWGVASRGTIRSGERADSRGTRTIRPHSGQAGQRERDVTSRARSGARGHPRDSHDPVTHRTGWAVRTGRDVAGHDQERADTRGTHTIRPHTGQAGKCSVMQDHTVRAVWRGATRPKQPNGRRPHVTSRGRGKGAHTHRGHTSSGLTQDERMSRAARTSTKVKSARRRLREVWAFMGHAPDSRITVLMTG
jgi:hypothetical protein